MEDRTIYINENVKCSECGEPGATLNGLCLPCVTRRVGQMGREKINHRVMSRILNIMRGLMEEHAQRLNIAMKKFPPKTFDIGFKAKLLDTKEGVGVMVEMNYLPEPKTIATDEALVVPDQIGLFESNVDPATGEVFEDED